MDTSKLQVAISELEAEAERCGRLAAELKAVIQRSANGSAHPSLPQRAPAHRDQGRLSLKHRAQKSVRTLALEILRTHQKAMHVDELVVAINEQRAEPTGRAAVESQLVRAIKKGQFGVKRTAPATFAVER